MRFPISDAFAIQAEECELEQMRMEGEQETSRRDLREPPKNASGALFRSVKFRLAVVNWCE
jgi:hypothetical protein